MTFCFDIIIYNIPCCIQFQSGYGIIIWIPGSDSGQKKQVPHPAGMRIGTEGGGGVGGVEEDGLLDDVSLAEASETPSNDEIIDESTENESDLNEPEED